MYYIDFYNQLLNLIKLIDKTKLKKDLNKGNLGTFYKTVDGGEGERCKYPTRLDTYGKGCFYDCKYCYAKSLLNIRKMWKPYSPATPKDSDLLNIIKKIPKGQVVRLGGMTDCFQPIERFKRTTYKTIKLLNKKGIHYLIVTKSNLIIRDEYLDVLNKDFAHIQVSVPSTNNKVLSFTDNAPTYQKRVETIETLYSKGFDISLRLAPILYDTVDYDLINSIQVDKCLVEFLRLKSVGIKNPLNKVTNLKYYTYYEGGYYHLPLKIKRRILSKIHFKETSVCEDVMSHYYYFQKNYNHNPNDCCNLKL